MQESRRAWVAIILAVSAYPASGEVKSCIACHADVWRTYRLTGMARSFSRPSASPAVEDFSRNETYYHAASDMHFSMIQRNGEWFQRQFQIAPDGKQINVVENRIDYVIGSGNHSRTYLHRTEKNTLLELPLAWYSEKGGYWAMNPGYDRPDHEAFRRRIDYSCMFCHNAYPELPVSEPITGEAVFGSLPEGIDCERCHGSSEQHVLLASKPGSARSQIRDAIVNPARLSPERELEVCMQCHLETTSFPLPHAIVRYDRKPFSYHPGEPLANFVLHFDQPAGSGYDDKFEIAGSAYRLRQSQCFLRSAGALRCTTCHNPHDIPRGAQAVGHYTAVCRNCHGPQFDSLVKAGKHTANEDCVGCHMPKRRTEDVVHVVMTDHKIQRPPEKDDLTQDIPERHGAPYRGEVAPYYPQPTDDLYLALAQVIDNSNLTQGIPRLAMAIATYRPQRPEFTLELANAWRHNGRCDEAVQLYRKLLETTPKWLTVTQQLGLCDLALGKTAEAVQILTEATEIAPEDAVSRNLLASAQIQAGRIKDAIASLEKAVQLDPLLVEAQNSLGAIWFQSGELARAESALRDAIRIQPNYAEAHDNLGNVLSAMNRFDEARYHFEQALRLKPDYYFARFNYSVALARAGQESAAEQQVRMLLDSQPENAEAHDLLGSLLTSRGDARAGIQQYKEALRLRPDFARAALHLGSTLAAAGDIKTATQYLEQAARSPNASIRDEATRKLKELRARIQ